MLTLPALLLAAALFPPADERRADERLSFQASGVWEPRVQLDADVAMVYGITKGLPERLATWKARGYRIHLMTGVAWGEYQDYFDGRWDGREHHAESQTEKNGKIIGHGPGVPYVSPGPNYGAYLAEGVLKALDAGAEAVHLEEPEFWVRGGWEEGFKTEWKAMYQEEWQPPDSSPDAQWKASKLKYFLYRRALAQVFDAVREYGKAHGRTIPCYVPTHSLINYTHWRIVSPESSLLDVGCDGYIAQVWTGTARTPIVYEGREKERTFDAAFLEYGVMQNLVRASGRRMWYLNDPIEDNPNHTWEDYRTNWESTLTASLFQPEVHRFEIMPWPHRIYNGKRPSGKPGAGNDRIPIPPAYETELAAVIHALGDMKQADVRWESSGTTGVGVLVSDTMMFQRAGPGGSDEHVGSFYGLALPLLKRGVPVEPVQIESAGAPGILDRYKLLVLTYEGQKPPTREFHAVLDKWVRAGGALVVVDDDKDAFNAVREWWNTAPLAYATPRRDLFDTLGVSGAVEGAPPGAELVVKVGAGAVVYAPISPAGLSHSKTGSATAAALFRKGAEAVGLAWKESPAIVLRRGPYVIAAGLDESPAPTPNGAPVTLKGRFIPLFDPTLALTREVTVAPGVRALLVDLERVPVAGGRPTIAAAACGVDKQRSTPDSLAFRAAGVQNSRAAVAILASKPPTAVTVAGKPLTGDDVQFADGLLRIFFTNEADGVDIDLRW